MAKPAMPMTEDEFFAAWERDSGTSLTDEGKAHLRGTLLYQRWKLTIKFYELGQALINAAPSRFHPDERRKRE